MGSRRKSYDFFKSVSHYVLWQLFEVSQILEFLRYGHQQCADVLYTVKASTNKESHAVRFSCLVYLYLV